MPLTHENFRLFSDYVVLYYLLALLKKALIKNLKFPLFPTYVPVTLVKSKLQIHPANPIFSHISHEIHHEVLINKVLIKI